MPWRDKQPTLSTGKPSNCSRFSFSCKVPGISLRSSLIVVQKINIWWTADIHLINYTWYACFPGQNTYSFVGRYHLKPPRKFLENNVLNPVACIASVSVAINTENQVSCLTPTPGNVCYTGMHAWTDNASKCTKRPVSTLWLYKQSLNNNCLRQIFNLVAMDVLKHW